MRIVFLIAVLISGFSIASLGAVTCESDAATIKKYNQQLRVQFTILSDTKLENVEVSLLNQNTSNYHEVIKRAYTTADTKGKDTDNLSHFDVSQDTSDKYELRLPKNISSLASFKGYLLVSFEHGKPSRMGLDCNNL